MEHLEGGCLGLSLVLTHVGWALSYFIIQPMDCDWVEERILISTTDSIPADTAHVPTYPFILQLSSHWKKDRRQEAPFLSLFTQ